MDQTIPEPNPCRKVPQSLIRTTLRVPFGLREGRMWTPRQVEPGAACGCSCPGCGGALVAKAQGSRKLRAHFAHLSGTDCEGGREKAIHKMAKQVICEAAEVLLPDWSGAGDLENPPSALDIRGQLHEGRRIYLPARSVRLDRTEEEYRYEAYVPDVRAMDDEGELLVEVRYRHPVDAVKLSRVRSDRRRMIEIDLSSLEDKDIYDMERFRYLVLEDPSNRVWLSMPKAYDQWRESKRELEAMVAERNQQLTAQWEAMQEAARRRQAEAVADAKDRAGRRAYMKARIRDEHSGDLAVLMELTDPQEVGKCLKRWQLEAEDRVSELLDGVAPAIRVACLHSHPDAWVFGVDPALWQLLVYRHFVAGRSAGMRFNNRDVAAWVRTSFSTVTPLYRLFLRQYRSVKEAQRAGFNKRRLSCWAFTDEENERIPHFYAPINELLSRLESARVVRALPSPVGEYEICEPPPHGLHPAAVTG